MNSKLLISAAGAAIFAGGIASAEVMATATTDLNVRSGPGAWHDVVGTIASGAEATVTECYTEANWCAVMADGVEGWSYGEYLVVGDEQVAVVAPEVVEQPTVYTIERLQMTEDTRDTSALGGAGFGALAGAIVAGPVGAAVGAAAGSTVGAAADPGPEFITYIEENPVEPVYLDGEIVVGGVIPEGVQLYEAPEEQELSYLNINGTPVIVSNENRAIVRVVN